MNRVWLMVIGGFAVAFAAGGSVGLLTTSGDARRAERPPAPRRPLAIELELTPAQQEQMRKIWSEVTGEGGMEKLHQRRTALHRQRVEAISALLTDDQRAKYEQVLADFERGMREIDQERQRLTDKAVQSTKAILSESQARRYEQMRPRWGRPGGPGGPPPGGPFGGRRGGPTSRPARFGPMGPPNGHGPFRGPGDFRGPRGGEMGANAPQR